MRINQGYKITDSIKINNIEFVIGHNPKAPSEYVVWFCTKGDYYYHGRYVNDKTSALSKLEEKVNIELSYLKDCHVKPIITTSMSYEKINDSIKINIPPIKKKNHAR